jgi:transposase
VPDGAPRSQQGRDTSGRAPGSPRRRRTRHREAVLDGHAHAGRSSMACRISPSVMPETSTWLPASSLASSGTRRRRRVVRANRQRDNERAGRAGSPATNACAKQRRAVVGAGGKDFLELIDHHDQSAALLRADGAAGELSIPVGSEQSRSGPRTTGPSPRCERACQPAHWVCARTDEHGRPPVAARKCGRG